MSNLSRDLFIKSGTVSSSTIAAFDLDWTLIRSVHGMFPKDANDFDFLPNRLEVIAKLIDDGFTIVIFTNQGYDGAKLTTAIGRLNNILARFASYNIFPWLLAATGRASAYRKPSPAMWQILNQYIPNINLASSFYVGDAAGRPFDHSPDDINFAAACGLKFYTPEEFFPPVSISIPTTQSMIISVGMPGSGKSTFAHQRLEPLGWKVIGQDTLKTHDKVLKAVEAALAAKQSVIVDNTNPTFEKRSDFLQLAIKYQVPTMILYFVGDGTGRNRLREKPVPTIAYNMYFSKLEEPDPSRDRVPVIKMI